MHSIQRDWESSLQPIAPYRRSRTSPTRRLPPNNLGGSFMMTKFDTRWETILSFPPQLAYTQTLGFVPGNGDTLPSSFIPGVDSLPPPTGDYELVRVMIFGSSYGVNYTIRWLYTLKFAQISEWSFLMPAPNGEFMTILTKRIPLNRVT